MRRLIIILSFGLLNLSLIGQVGIGNQTPHQNSILDLTNADELGLLLPIRTGVPPTSPNVPGLLTFNAIDSLIYYTFGTNTNEFNALTPWKFKYENESTNNVYFDRSGGKVGIGVQPPLNTMPGKITVFHSGSVSGSGGDDPFLFLGSQGGQQLVFDANEVMSKSDDATPGTLHLQKNGGEVNIGNVSNSTLTVSGNINTDDKIQENNNDLIPTGVIVMWSGNTASVPSGWAICNGSNGTPDLRDRFVVGAGSSYSYGNTGGNNSSAHTHSVDPPSLTISGGNHTHSGTTGGPSGTTGIADCNVCSNTNAASTGHTHTFSISSSGSHSHTVNIPSFTSAGASFTDNRPLYYAVTYIMKL